MKKKIDLRVSSHSTLKKLVMELKIAILVVFINVANVFATNTYSQIAKATLDEDPQQITVTGTITDASTGEPMPGVNVLVKGTATGALTDANGKYTLPVSDPQNAVLVFSFIGYGTTEIPVAGQTIINASLKATLTGLDEVVVIGYGTAKRADLTGSVSSISSARLQDLSMTRIDQGILGKMAGVQVKAVSGAPGAGVQIRIRGIGSISASTEPLYVIDGVPTEEIQTLNPNDIESIDILKDASATAIYGSRGSNGVIIITTKRGKEGPARITFDTYYGLQGITYIPPQMDAQEMAQYALESIMWKNLDAGGDISGHPTTWNYPMPSIAMSVVEGTWTYDRHIIHDLLRIAPKSQYQLTASGGTENLQYSLSTEHLNTQGIVIKSWFKRYSARSNIDAQVSKKLSVQLNLNPSYSTQSVPDESSGSNYGSYTSSSPINKAQLWQPYMPALNEDGSYFRFSSVEASPEANPYAEVMEQKNFNELIRILGNMNIGYEITDDLRLNIMLGANLMYRHSSRFIPSLEAFGSGGGTVNTASGTDQSRQTVNWLTEYTGHYNKSIGKHYLDAVVGFTVEKSESKNSSLGSNRYPNNLVSTLSAVSNIITSGTSSKSEWSLISYLGRVNYNYDSKYYLTATIRRDGSSRFGSENKWGVFPSAAIAWRISGENFLNSVGFLTDMKLKVSYGRTGNNSIGNYEQYSTISYNRYVLGGSVVQGFSPNNLSNPYLTWETQDQVNGGVEIRLFKDRLSFDVNYFKSVNKDLLLDVNIPAISGFETTKQNMGKVQNIGLEFSASTVNVQGDFVWATDFNISTYKNKVLKLGPNDDPIYQRFGMVSGSSITMVGQPLGMFYGYIVDGIFLNQEEIGEGPLFGEGTWAESRPGDYRFKDINGDGKITSSDITIMGDPYPDFYYGMSNRFSYKNVSLNIDIQGTKGNQILNQALIGWMNLRGARVAQSTRLSNWWKSEDDIGDGVTPRPNDSPKGNNRAMSSRYLDTGSFLRINNITLSYTFPNRIINKMGVNSIRIYLTSTNPYTFTNNDTCFNPDVSNSGNPLTPGMSFSDYPLTRDLTFGLTVSF